MILSYIFICLTIGTALSDPAEGVVVTSLDPGTVRVTWSVWGGDNQYKVRLHPQYGPPIPFVLVNCDLQTSPENDACEVTFLGLSDGHYEAEVVLVEAALLEASPTAAFTVTNATKVECYPPFSEIGGRCFMVETYAVGTWQEMNNFCVQQGGRLAVVDDANVLYFLVQFMKDNGLTSNDYWIGATDEAEEGDFRWVNGDKMRMGTPYWGWVSSGGVQEPNGGTAQNCVYMWSDAFNTFNDRPCTDNKRAICEQA